jgi:hypothetical protein
MVDKGGDRLGMEGSNEYVGQNALDATTFRRWPSN